MRVTVAEGGGDAVDLERRVDARAVGFSGMNGRAYTEPVQVSGSLTAPSTSIAGCVPKETLAPLRESCLTERSENV